MSLELRTLPLTGTIIGLLILIFILGRIGQILGYDELIGYTLIALPQTLTPGLIISNFSHLQIWHLLSNLYALYVIGNEIESEQTP